MATRTAARSRCRSSADPSCHPSSVSALQPAITVLALTPQGTRIPAMGVMRRMFGPSKKELWTKLSEELHGRFVASRWGNGDKVQVTHHDWTLTLDTYVV